MFRFLSLLITLPLSVFVILFAVSNTQNATVNFNILDAHFTLPQYGITLGMMALGFIAGSLLVWLNLYHYRIRYWQTQKKLQRYEEKHEAIRDNQLEQSKSLVHQNDRIGEEDPKAERTLIG